jgi:hypothetical protein
MGRRSVEASSVSAAAQSYSVSSSFLPALCYARGGGNYLNSPEGDLLEGTFDV